MALEYFITNSWKFLNDKGMALEHELLPCDYDNFGYKYHDLEPREYFKRAMYGGRQYLLKDSPETLPTARRDIRR